MLYWSQRVAVDALSNTLEEALGEGEMEVLVLVQGIGRPGMKSSVVDGQRDPGNVQVGGCT